MESDSSWEPSDLENRASSFYEGRRKPFSPSSSSSSTSSESDSEEVSSSDLDEFIMSTSQSGTLSRQRKKSRKTGEKRKKKRRATLATPIGRVSQQVRDLLGQGHNAFLKRDYETAVSLLEEAIRLAPGVADPFVTLGAIYEEIGDPKRSIEALLVAVHLTPGDKDLWKRVAIMSQSVGNVEQAIYCLKRCVKAVSGGGDKDLGEDQDDLRDLANLYVHAGKFAEACAILRKLFPLALQEGQEAAAELGTLLAKSLYNVNEKSEAMMVLEKLAPSTVDANVINMLAEVYLDTREWGRCFSLLTSVLDMDHLEDPEKCPVDLVAKLALAAAPNFARHKEICRKSVACLIATPVETHSDLYLLVADGLIANNLIDSALSLLRPALSAFQLNQDPAILAGIHARTGKCYFAQGRFQEAASLLEQFVSFEKSQGRRVDPDSLVMLADAWRQVGRESEAGELLLHSLNYEDLVACRTLPAATSTTQRRQWLETLQRLLETHGLENLASRDSNFDIIRPKFANIFLQLLNDCELDVQRIARHRLQQQAPELVNNEQSHSSLDEAFSSAGSRAVLAPAWKLRKELDLESVEDHIGSERFVQLALAGARVCGASGRGKEAVELLEAILHNKRKKWAQQAEEEGVGFIESIEKLSFELALQTGITKVSTKYLRQLAVEAISAGPEIDQISLEAALATMTRLMFVSNVLSVREILDQRSWLVRQACKTPNIFAICLMCGHMCIYSMNYKFASEEYLRAHRLRPEDPFPLLCLGASLLSLAMSRTTRDRQFTVIKAFAVLSEYARKRGDTMMGEIEYNLGRAFHQLSLWTWADRHYKKSLLHLPPNDPLRRVVSYNLHLIRVRSGSSDAARELLLSSIVAS